MRPAGARANFGGSLGVHASRTTLNVRGCRAPGVARGVTGGLLVGVYFIDVDVDLSGVWCRREAGRPSIPTLPAGVAKEIDPQRLVSRVPSGPHVVGVGLPALGGQRGSR